MRDFLLGPMTVEHVDLLSSCLSTQQHGTGSCRISFTINLAVNVRTSYTEPTTFGMYTCMHIRSFVGLLLAYEEKWNIQMFAISFARTGCQLQFSLLRKRHRHK